MTLLNAAKIARSATRKLKAAKEEKEFIIEIFKNDVVTSLRLLGREIGAEGVRDFLASLDLR